MSLFFFSARPRAISSNKMSWSSATMWPSNNTWLWLHLLMGEKWVFYITVVSVGVDRAKTLNPLFNLLDQFSSTYTPLRKCRIITGYLHFILIFTHKKKRREIIDKTRRRPLCPFNSQRRHDPIRQIHWSSTYLQIKLLQTLNCVSTANLLPWRMDKKAGVLNKYVCRG